MPGFFKRPDPQKSFFSNYIDHLHALVLQTGALWEDFNKLKSSEEKEDFVWNTLNNRNLLLHPIRDGHDYMDEVMGATVLPAVAFMTAAGALVASVWEGAQALAIHWGLMQNDHKDHADNALGYIITAAAALTISVVSFIKSWISMVSRLVATVEQGFAKQDAPRFYNEDKEPGVESLRDGAKGFVDGIADTVNNLFKP
ncbi:hypothetical protein ACD661_13215 [Legionella lytica]|uniref:Uncharacterized protein n=1 Tax=Legionella lytica TaxID=96232 RepID=A0ABW8DE88_9GAMM